MGKKTETAKEIVDRLLNNPEYCEMMKEKKLRRSIRNQDLENIERPIIQELERSGVHAEDISDLISKYAPLPPEIVKILLSWISKIEQDNVLDMLVRALAAPAEPYDGSPLVRLFEATNSLYGLRWVIGNTIECAVPTNITEWVVNAVQNTSYGGDRSRLCLALVKMVPPERAIPILQSLFDQLATPCAEALGKIGNDESVLQFLREKEQKQIDELPHKIKGTIPYNKIKTAIKEIQSAIKKIEKRMLRGQKKK
jgi:hypothetical protein